MVRKTKRSPSPRRLVIHVGPHKTASSYIQVNLNKSRRELEKARWIYPTAGTGGNDAHHDIVYQKADYLNPDSDHFKSLAKVGEVASRNNCNILLSAEGFCTWKNVDFVSLARALGFHALEIVYVIRNPLDVFPSFWAEEVKHGHTRGFTEKFALEFVAPGKSRILNPMWDIRPLQSDPRITVHAVPYDLLNAKSIDVFEHIARDVLGLDNIRAVHSHQVNAKYPVELTEFLRLVTLFYSDGARRIGSDLRLAFTACFSEQEQRDFAKILRLNGKDAWRVIKIPKDYAFLDSMDKSLRESLAKNWTLDLTGVGSLFQNEEQRYVYYDAFVLSQSTAVMDAVNTVLRRLRE